MSEEPTQDMPKKYDTKPTIETVLERMDAMRSEMRSDIRSDIHSEIQAVRVEMQVGFDRLESIVSGTRSEVLAMRAEFLTLRADFRELRHALGEHLPASKA